MNIICYLFLAGFLLLFPVLSIVSGYPWALNCYNCSSCSRSCVLGINPTGFISAATTNNPQLVMAVSNVRMKLGEAARLDPEMVIATSDGAQMTAEGAIAVGMLSDMEIMSVKMKAQDAARYCLLCGNCEKDCPVNLTLMNIIKDLKDDGKFNR
jgi:L-lactate utilization protein LutB